jgi:hypothetical protein
MIEEHQTCIKGSVQISAGFPVYLLSFCLPLLQLVQENATLLLKNISRFSPFPGANYVSFHISLNHLRWEQKELPSESFCQIVLRAAQVEILRLEFINLMHNFIYSIIILHHDPQHVSSIAVLVFRRTIVYLQYLVLSHSVCCHTVHRSRAACSPLLIGALM